MKKTGGAVRHKYNQSEIDFIIKSASVLVQNTFASSNKISIDCNKVLTTHSLNMNTSSFSLMEEVPKEYLTTRSDIILIYYKGIKAGCGEVKPLKKSRELIDIDRAIIAEIGKKQIHLRLQISLSSKEHCKFGILVGGMVLELTKLQFDNGKFQDETKLMNQLKKYLRICIVLNKAHEVKAVLLSDNNLLSSTPLKTYSEDSRGLVSEAVESLNAHFLGLKIAKNTVHDFMANEYALTIRKHTLNPKKEIYQKLSPHDSTGIVNIKERVHYQECSKRRKVTGESKAKKTVGTVLGHYSDSIL
ncbi:hypothetical protein K501DRAFT_268073 [Backusella circina FSU 941]|nr:hypothetical protein K501DRAFT_268073 [Backusella circina FSU 941]